MRTLALINGFFVILAVLVFCGLDVTIVFACAALVVFAIDCVAFYGVATGRKTFVERFITWINK